jgi:YVTN family beta-propeller protein
MNPVLRPGIVVSRDGASVYVSLSQPEGQGPDSLKTVDAASGKVLQDRVLEFHPGQLAVGPDPGVVYVSGCHGLCSDGTLHTIDLAAQAPTASITLRTMPSGMAISSDGGRAYVANASSASLQIVDLEQNAVVASVPVGAGPLGVALSPDDSRVYVTNFDGGTLSVIDARTASQVAIASVGPTPRAIAVTPDGRFAYLTRSESYVSIVDLNRLGT